MKQLLKGLIRNTLPPLRGNPPGHRMIRHLRRRAFWGAHQQREGSRAQYGQDSFVLDRIGSAGTFLDIGAHDGVSFSNTLLLEQSAWSGICVEPNPNAFSRLQANRQCQCLNLGIAESPATLDFTQVSGYGEMLSGFAVTEESVRRVTQDREVTIAHIQVPCTTVAQIVHDCRIDRIDYLSIDTEGMEFQILKTIDLDKLGVRIASIENNRSDDSVELYMRHAGFRLETILGGDLMFVRAKRRGNPRVAPEKCSSTTRR